MTKGFTLLEMTIAIVVILTIAGLAFPRISGTFDQIATDRALGEV